MAAEIALSAAITGVLAAWQELVARGEMSEQTLSRFGQLLHRFAAFAAVRGARLLAEVDAAVAAQFIDAHGRTRHGHVAPASLSTRHLRRSVLRMCFATARRLALTDTDPTRDIDLPPRVCGATRPLEEAEAVELRRAAQFTARPTRHAAAAALALAGAFSGEIGHIGSHDLDLPGARVWVHGSAKTQPRWCPWTPSAPRYWPPAPTTCASQCRLSTGRGWPSPPRGHRRADPGPRLCRPARPAQTHRPGS